VKWGGQMFNSAFDLSFLLLGSAPTGDALPRVRQVDGDARFDHRKSERGRWGSHELEDYLSGAAALR
jgi:hypothetical protein